MAIERVEAAIEVNEGGIRQLFPIRTADTSGEFHFTFPTEVSMININTQENLNQDITSIKFQVQIKFNMYLATDEGRKGAEVVARADVIDDGVRLKAVDIGDLRGTRRVSLEDMDVGQVGNQEAGVGRGEGEGKTIDATKWTSR